MMMMMMMMNHHYEHHQQQQQQQRSLYRNLWPSRAIKNALKINHRETKKLKYFSSSFLTENEEGEVEEVIEEQSSSHRSSNNRSSDTRNTRKRDLLTQTMAIMISSFSISFDVKAVEAKEEEELMMFTFTQRFPTLFKPFLGNGTKKTIKTTLVENRCWALEQTIELGPLETPLRCVVIRLNSGELWVHNPLAPTQEFFSLVESCASNNNNKVAAIVVSTYALEHKIFAKDAHEKWPEAEIWIAPGQFSFPQENVSNEFLYGTKSNVFVLSESNDLSREQKQPKWSEEINYETLDVGAFNVGNSKVQIKECAFFDVQTGMLIVTDSLCKIPSEPPVLSSKEKLLLVGKRSTKDEQPEDTRENILAGWKKTALLVTFFFPEHEELISPTEVIWSDGWEKNFASISNRLFVPPVVRTLLYAQDPKAVRNWVDRVSERFGDSMKTIVPAHWEAPIEADVKDFRRAFRFLEDDSIDSFLEGDLKRGLAPIAKAILEKQR